MTNVVVCQQRNKTTHKVLVGEGPDNPMFKRCRHMAPYQGVLYCKANMVHTLLLKPVVTEESAD